MDQAKALLDLQKTDLAIARLEKQLAEMPEKRAILQARKRIRDIEALETRTDVFIVEIERTVARLEDEVATVSAKMGSEQAKLFSGKITVPKEVQHISNELDALRRRKDRLEDDILVEMEKRERALEQRMKIRKAKEAAQESEAGLVDGFKGKGGDLQQEIEELAVRRERLEGVLEVEVRKRYSSHRALRGGVTVGVLRESTCGSCRMELSAETVRELLAGPDIAECPLCHRILVVRVEEDGTE